MKFFARIAHIPLFYSALLSSKSWLCPCKRPKDEANITCTYSVQFSIICQPDVYNVCVCVFGGGGRGVVCLPHVAMT